MPTDEQTLKAWDELSELFNNAMNEIGLWTMHVEDWNRLSEWLNGFRTETQWKLDQILMEYYKTNPEIRRFEDNEYNTE